MEEPKEEEKHEEEEEHDEQGEMHQLFWGFYVKMNQQKNIVKNQTMRWALTNFAFFRHALIMMDGCFEEEIPHSCELCK